MGMSMPNANCAKKGSDSRRWITDSFPARTATGYKPSATNWAPSRSTPCCAAGWPRLPHPFTPQDREAGYRYDLSILQAEFALTQVLDRPLTGRLLFEEIIRENLDLGRPSQVQLIFARRMTKR